MLHRLDENDAAEIFLRDRSEYRANYTLPHYTASSLMEEGMAAAICSIFGKSVIKKSKFTWKQLVVKDQAMESSAMLQKDCIAS